MNSINKIIYNSFSNISCYDCRYDGFKNYHCEDCLSGISQWKPSRQFYEDLVKDILNYENDLKELS